jgi:hypothetical protein
MRPSENLEPWPEGKSIGNLQAGVPGTVYLVLSKSKARRKVKNQAAPTRKFAEVAVR